MQRAIAAIGLAQYSPACVFIETCVIQDGNHRQPWHVLLAIETAHMQNLQMFILHTQHSLLSILSCLFMPYHTGMVPWVKSLPLLAEISCLCSS